MISRRAVLTGVAGTAVVGAAGVVTVGPRRALHLVGLDRSPDHHVPESGWEVRERAIDSAAMGRAVPWAISVDPAGVRGVVVCLHGRNNDHRYAFDQVHLHDMVAAAGGGLAVVSVDGGRASYWHRRADGTDAMALVVDELLPTVFDELGELPTAVMGWSMGGYGALLLAQRHRHRFVAAVATSPALWRSFEESADGAFDNADDFAAHDVFAGIDDLGSLPVHIDCGTGDGFVDAARDFATQMPATNLGRFSHGYHDARYSRSVAPRAIATILEFV